MIEVHAEFPQREVIQANAVVDNEEKTISEVIISAKPEITGVTASVDNETGTPYVEVTETGTGTEFSFDLAFHNLKGEQGIQGIQGVPGQDGQDGISPTAEVTQTAEGATITVTDVSGTTSANILNGKDGQDGQDGADGQAATITVGTTTTGAAGTNASVVNSGTSSAAILDFTIPRGNTGAMGVSVTGVSLISTQGLQKTYRMTFSDNTYYDYIVTDGASGSTAWGGISGTLSDQTDLQTELTGLQNQINDKQDTIDSNNKLSASYVSGLATVATSGSYNDLLNKPTIPDISNLANQDLSNLSATGEAHFQEPLVSGTNIKTINNNSILGSGNINTKEIFIAEYGVTTYQEVLEAYNNRKNIICFYALDTNSVYVLHLSNFASSYGYFLFCGVHFNEYSQKYTYLRSNDAWDNIGTWVNEVTSNKVTSISSSSTNTQYPSAKLLYDQLALKQNASTAVTHTANTAVGSSTTPVYINSSGVATSTGLSIASSRFDGQWVLFSNLISLSTATSATTTDVTSTIKSNMGTAGTDSYKYELLIQTYCNYKSATASLNAITSNQATTISAVSSGTTMGRFFGRITVAADKVLKFQRTAAMDACTIYFCGYRRIGTNS